MISLRRLARGFSILASTAAIAIAAPVQAEDLIIDHVTLVDGTGGPEQPGMSVGVDKGRITFVTPTSLAPRVPGRHLDGSGRYLMPGLMDVHIHLKGARGGSGKDISAKDISAKEAHDSGAAALASYLYSGVTTIYDAGNKAEHILGLRAEERAGKILAPHIFATGNLVTYPGSHGSDMAVTISSWPQDREKLLRYLDEQKPDIVKLTLEEHGWGTRPLIPLLPIVSMPESKSAAC